MKFLPVGLFVGVLALSLAGRSHAQIMPNAGHLSFQDRTAFLLTASSIRDELGLSDTQRKSLDRYWLDHANKVEDVAAKPNFNQRMIENLDRQVAGQSIATLDAAQKARLRELGLQYLGPRALLDAGIARDFELGNRQLSGLKSLYEAYDAKLGQIDERIADALGGEVPPKDPAKLKDYNRRRDQALKVFEAERDAIRKTRGTVDARALDVLNGDQLSKWKKSLGKPFVFVGSRD
jgi:hypothetical protein